MHTRKEGLLNDVSLSGSIPLLICAAMTIVLSLSMFHFFLHPHYRLITMSNVVHQPESPPTNARHITSPTSLGSPLDQNHSSDDEPYEVPSPSMSEGNQMGYYLKYGRSPPGLNSSAALEARMREFQVWWSTQNAEQGAVCWWCLTKIDFSSSYIRH